RKNFRRRCCCDFQRSDAVRRYVRRGGLPLMNVSVGLIELRPAVDVELIGTFVDPAGHAYSAGRHRFTSEIMLTPSDPSCAFALDDITIGIGFHWERKERQVFRGALRIITKGEGLTVINDVSLEEYVTSVISSEMSASCPPELLKAHAVISRSWLLFPKAQPSPGAPAEREPVRAKPQERAAGPEQGSHAHEILRWYGREAH